VPEAVGRLVTDIEAELDTVVDGIVARIRDEIPHFRRLPASTLARAARGSVGRALAALRDLRPPTTDELERTAAVSQRGELARERGTNVSSVLALGQEGVFSLADLSIRPAILSDEALGQAFTGRHLEPLQALGRLGAELEDTLRVWFEQEMRIDETANALHVHPNTLRHRLRRFEETTGANLRRPADLIELWWALERRRLGRTAPAPPAPARSPTRGSSAAPAAGPV